MLDRRNFIKMTGGSALALTLEPLVSWADGPSWGGSVSALAKELAQFDALGQAELFQTGAVTATELVETAIERIQALNPVINAIVDYPNEFITIDWMTKAFDEALQRAAELDLAGSSDPWSAVPYGAKGLQRVAGFPNHWGSRSRVTNDPSDVRTSSQGVVRVLQNNGGVFVGKCSAPELGLTSSTASVLWGPCINPWKQNFSVGGSSGGSAAAVAAGMVPIATAGDGGGSTRLPASACGTVGFKYSRGRIGSTPPEGSSLVVNGVESRTVRDTARFLDLHEQQSGGRTRLDPVGYVTGPSTSRLRIAFTTVGNDASVQTHPHTRMALEDVAHTLEDLGHDIFEARFPQDGDLTREHFMAIWTSGLSRALDTPDVYEELTLGMGREELETLADNPNAVAEAVAYFEDLRIKYEEWHAAHGYDLTLTPVASSPSDNNQIQDPERTPYENIRRDILAWVNFTPLHNAVGAPSLSLPLGAAPNGMPVGSMFSGPNGTEAKILGLAYELEEALPWIDRRPRDSVFNM